jgi:hypothetical protein
MDRLNASADQQLALAVLITGTGSGPTPVALNLINGQASGPRGARGSAGSRKLRTYCFGCVADSRQGASLMMRSASGW